MASRVSCLTDCFIHRLQVEYYDTLLVAVITSCLYFQHTFIVQSEMNSSVGSYTATNDRVNVSGVSSYDSNSNNPYGPQQTYSASSQGSYQQYPKVQTQAQQPPAKATAYQPAPVAKLAPNQSNAKMPYSAASLPESIAVPSISAISAIAGANTADKPSRRGNPSKDAADSRQGRGSAPATSNRGHSSFESSKNSGRPSYDEPANLSKYGPSSANSRLATGGRTSVKDAREDTRGARSTNSARARSRSRLTFLHFYAQNLVV